ncbi:MAG: methylated-DNA--[protein]-cysteine S-methyltransferase [Thermofilum sp.]|nr:methylated-DNA--[protein]-cysteine S-methyltransferase [Thermofilum sp.]
MEYGCFSTIIGTLCALVDSYRVYYLDALDLASYRKYEGGAFVRRLEAEVEDYLDGERCSFSFQPVIRGSGLRRSVLEEVMLIPCGATATYKEVAMRVGASSPRLVGRILSSNDILIVVPCHRVVSVRGLGGYKLGVDVKKKLLSIEREMCGG